MTTKGQQPPILEEQVLGFIKKHYLLPPHQRILVAVSGGPDSTCLLHILAKLRGELDIELHVAHLNHQLRGTEADADARYVSELAHKLSLPATIGQGDVKAHQALKRLSLEEAAREVRYTFLAQTATDVGASRVAIGHTRNDHIETLLMHLIRGTGTRGLRGLQPYTVWQSKPDNIDIVRPLLQITREEILSYCTTHQLKPRTDLTNLSLPPLRNRIRHQLLPLLKSYNPRVAEALVRTARIASDDFAFLKREASLVWDEIAEKQDNIIVLDKEGFITLPPALQRHLLRAALENLMGNIQDIETRHVDQMMSATTKPAGKKINLPEGLVFSTEYDRYLIGTAPEILSPFPVISGEFELNLPGKTLIPGWQVTADIQNPEQVLSSVPNNPFGASLDLDKTGDKAIVRVRQPGDRFQPQGMPQTKKLGEFMIDAKIPHDWRPRIPIVCSPHQILWVVGWRIDDRVKITEKTRLILHLEFEPVEPVHNT